MSAIEEQMQRDVQLKNEFFLADAVNIMLERGARFRVDSRSRPGSIPARSRPRWRPIATCWNATPATFPWRNGPGIASAGVQITNPSSSTRPPRFAIQ